MTAEIPQHIIENAARAAWNRIAGGPFGLPTWDEYEDEDVKDAYLEDQRAALAAVWSLIQTHTGSEVLSFAIEEVNRKARWAEEMQRRGTPIDPVAALLDVAGALTVVARGAARDGDTR